MIMKNKSNIFILSGSVFYILFGGFTLLNMVLNYDEGFHQYLSYLFAKGILAPYKDVFTCYPPLAYYVYGIFQRFLGPSFLVGRVVAFLLSFLAILMVIKICINLQDKVSSYYRCVVNCY